MGTLQQIVRRLSFLRDREEWEQQANEEMQFHLAMREQRNRENGMPDEEARNAALRQFGNPALLRERGRDAWGWSVLDDFLHDSQVAARGLRRNPGYTMLAAGTLALAIGACTAVFTLAYALLLGPLPYSDADRLTLIHEERKNAGFTRSDTSPANFRHLQSASTSFRQMALFHGNGATLTGDGEAERIDGANAGTNFFDVLGVKAARGRLFREGDTDMVVISHELWQRRYGGDPNLLGKTIRLNEVPHVVIGILPPRFQFLFPDAQFWKPLNFSPATWARRDLRYLTIVARLRDNVGTESAQAELDSLAPQFIQAAPEANRNFRAVAVPLRRSLLGDVRERVLLLAVAVCLVLLIGCANVAHLILSRSVRRSSEFAVRLSLGASRGRLVRQLMAESLAVAIAGGLIGFGVAMWSLRVLQFLIPTQIAAFTEVRADGRAFAIAMLLATVACLISGLIPALRIAAINWHQAIRQGSSRVVGGLRQERLRGALVVSEVALAVVLLVGASLLGRTLKEVLDVNTGFRAEGVLTAVTIPPRGLQTLEGRTAFLDEALRRVKAIPGVANAAYMSAAPFTWKGGRLNFAVEGQLPAPDQGALNRQVTPEYFRTLRIPLRAGREFSEYDNAGSARVAIVNEAMERRHFDGGSAIGRRLRVNGPGFDDQWITVVGVVADVKEMGIVAPAQPVIYLPPAQTKADFNLPFELAVRTDGNPTLLAAPIRQTLGAAWPSMPIAKMRPLTDIVEIEMAQRGPMAMLASGLAGVALVLAIIGIYGLLAFSVAQRIPEIGVRMALGAQASDIFRGVVQRGLILAVAGVGAGLVLSIQFVQLLRGLLYGIRPVDPATFALAPAAVMAIAFLACLIPARTAIRVEPSQALRSE